MSYSGRKRRVVFGLGPRPQKYLSVSNRAKLQRARFGGVAVVRPRRVRMVAPSGPLMRQVRGLLAAKTRDAADVTRSATQTGSLTKSSCLTSSTNYSTAANGTGLLDTDADEVLINGVRIAGIMDNATTIDADPTGNFPTMVRQMVVWFNKPLQVAAAGGGLPAVTEVLVTDNIASMPVNASSNGGRFVILSDRTWNLGENVAGNTAGTGWNKSSGRNRFTYDYRVKVNKKCKFVAPAASGASAGGHYDSAASPGRVTTGLLVMYQLYVAAATSSTSNSCVTRLNYTG